MYKGGKNEVKLQKMDNFEVNSTVMQILSCKH